jgi:hypothetical protein
VASDAAGHVRVEGCIEKAERNLKGGSCEVAAPINEWAEPCRGAAADGI